MKLPPDIIADNFPFFSECWNGKYPTAAQLHDAAMLMIKKLREEGYIIVREREQKVIVASHQEVNS